MTYVMRIWLFVVLSVILAACAQMGMPAADTFNKKEVAAHATVTAIAKGALTLRQAGKLSDADRDNVVATLRTAETGIDLAKMVATTDPVAGMSKLNASVAVLNALQDYLLTKEK